MSNLLAFKRGDTSLDKLRAYYADPEKYPLSPTLEAVRERLQYVMQLRLNYWNKQKIVTFLKEKFDIEQAQAYSDIRNSELLYGEINETSRKAKQALLYEYSFQLLQRARERGDTKVEAKAIELMSKFGGLDQEENLEFNPEKFEAVTPKLSVNNKAMAKFMEMIVKGVVDLNDFNATDVDFEEVNNEETEEEDGSR
ncbi:hypothetical protein [Paenimyroides baculatum]|uniref:Uncharacterized protein n=1 Tax=Paenimyroides baculatum TaxID=2608000 RepID=A0A5M6CCD1_9FLAO|nr:hypothetical protein [Paenimyroides baculatum]KAA5532804.1 hypothetical protein F0460_13240 [Paenimyroides baculatum]